MLEMAADGILPRSVGVIEARFDHSLLSAHGLVFERNGRRLIDGIDLALRPEHRTIVMGANGSGKSLLLRLMHGLLTPSGGQVLWQGRPLDRAARSAQALVFQTPVMLRRSVRANLKFALSVRGIRGRERSMRVEEALELGRLVDLADQPARVLSGGEQQRLAVARALICAPRLMFLDEPTASLDPASTAAIEQLLDAAHGRGVTLVLVTHDRGQAQRLADDIVFLHAGRVVETGPADRVLSAPRSEPARAWLEGRLYFDQ
ncbi:MAG: ATP-binding cassette domain-containing protein [Pseudomonadota bacterium]